MSSKAEIQGWNRKANDLRAHGLFPPTEHQETRVQGNTLRLQQHMREARQLVGENGRIIIRVTLPEAPVIKSPLATLRAKIMLLENDKGKKLVNGSHDAYGNMTCEIVIKPPADTAADEFSAYLIGDPLHVMVRIPIPIPNIERQPHLDNLSRRISRTQSMHYTPPTPHFQIIEIPNDAITEIELVKKPKPLTRLPQYSEDTLETARLVANPQARQPRPITLKDLLE